MTSPQVEADPVAGRAEAATVDRTNPLFDARTVSAKPHTDPPPSPPRQEHDEAPTVAPVVLADRTEPLRSTSRTAAEPSDDQPTAAAPAEPSPAAVPAELRERRTGWRASVGGAIVTLGLVAVVALALVVALRLLNVAPGWLSWLTEGPGWWHSLIAVGGTAAVLLAIGGTLVAVAPKRTVEVQAGSPLHAKGWYAMFAGALFLSGDTSARYFTQVLHFHPWETAVVFLLIEIGLLSAALEMRDILTRPDGERAGLGKARALLWTLFGGQAIVAVALNIDPRELVVRLVFAGLGLLAIHQALGVDVREARRHSGTTGEQSYFGRLVRELRDAALSWTGLGEPERDALQRRRERAADRYARLLSEGKPPGDGERRWSAAARWTRKVRRARRRANLHDATQQERVVRVMQHERADDELMNARLPKLFDLPTPPAADTGDADRPAVDQTGEQRNAWWNAAG
ncbi:hypothetical protein [Amycolatopsis sp. NPDC051903]|uniref:hypothetical protein n=1 Tax=Amycolatopsis sp. NPDC051903 TaxID=3363936 RepID=UPI0037ABAB94